MRCFRSSAVHLTWPRNRGEFCFPFHRRLDGVMTTAILGRLDLFALIGDPWRIISSMPPQEPQSYRVVVSGYLAMEELI
jgi:hypothetical protein